MKVAYAACDITKTGQPFAEKLVSVFLPSGRALGRLVQRQGYADLIDRAFLPILRGPKDKHRKALLDALQAAMDGKVVERREEFYLKNAGRGDAAAGLAAGVAAGPGGGRGDAAAGLASGGGGGALSCRVKRRERAVKAVDGRREVRGERHERASPPPPAAGRPAGTDGTPTGGRGGDAMVGA
ncbi:MAG: hypothetical protein R3F65_05020 [bacterium]|nr:hypothetical protein [Myxococcales bacterium]